LNFASLCHPLTIKGLHQRAERTDVTLCHVATQPTRRHNFRCNLDGGVSNTHSTSPTLHQATSSCSSSGRRILAVADSRILQQVQKAGRSGDRIPVGARFSAPVQTGPGSHPASYTMGPRSFPGVKSGRGVTLTPHTLLGPRSRNSRAIPLLPLRTVRPVQSLSACTRVHFTFYYTNICTNKLWTR
jgi:hypothetical protein